MKLKALDQSWKGVKMIMHVYPTHKKTWLYVHIIQSSTLGLIEWQIEQQKLV